MNDDRRLLIWENSETLTTIRSFTNQAEAALCLSFLQGNEFDAVLLDEGSFLGNYAGIAIPIRLQVPEEQAEDAVALLAAMQNEETGFRP